MRKLYWFIERHFQRFKIYCKIRNIIRKPIVDKRIETGRYTLVGENAYLDNDKNCIVKGYYDKPFVYTSKLFIVDDDE